MNLLTPLGLLGLLGLIVLLLIYIIKPNYQNKIISSTFIWKLSLKYKKKKIPVNTLRHIITLICQVLAITAASFILTQPFIQAEDKGGNEAVVIIDGSASMLTEAGGVTRFERAVQKARADIDKLLDDGKRVSVILADDEAGFIAQSVDLNGKPALSAELDALMETVPCSLTVPDIDGAMKLAENVTAYVKNASVTLYSDTHYVQEGKVTVERIADLNEWNAAILDVRATLVDNYYRFEIDVASYGKDSDLKLYCTFNGVNSDDSTVEQVAIARCTADQVRTVVFYTDIYEDKNGAMSSADDIDEILSIYSYDSLHVSLSEDDSFSYDDNFFLYGGSKPELNIQYYSAMPNNFFSTSLMVLRDQLDDYWDVNVTEVKYEEVPATEGFDLYIFEHYKPTEVPKDGIVFYANPVALPSSTGIQLGNAYHTGGTNYPLSEGEDHPIMKNVNAENITITRYTAISNYDGYVPLMYAGSTPVVMVSEDPDTPIVVMTFSLNYSNLPLLLEFPIFVYNLVEYFIPETFDRFVYDIGDTVTLNSRSDRLHVTGPELDETLTELPHSLTVGSMGTYTVTQELLSGDTLIESFYVKLDAEESNISLEKDVLTNPYYYQETDSADTDLLLYFAIALVALLFIEWWLKSREQL